MPSVKAVAQTTAASGANLALGRAPDEGWVHARAACCLGFDRT